MIEPASVREIELKVDAEIERDNRTQWVREASGIAATVAGVAAVGSTVAAAPEALIAAALATGAGAVIGRVAAFARRAQDEGTFLGRRDSGTRPMRPDPFRTLAPARLAARQHLTLASKDRTLVDQESGTA